MNDSAVTHLPVPTPAIRPILTPTTFDQLVIFAEHAAGSDLVPKDYRGKPANIMIACQMGAELGLSPMQALLSIAVINGRPGVWGDGLIGLCRQSPLCQDIVETFEGEGEERAAVCTAKRRNASTTTARFSVADAKRAGLWGKDIWQKYPDRMLQNRARGFCLRDAFPDLLRGLKTVEELRDYPQEEDDFKGKTLDARPTPQAAVYDTPRPTPAPAKKARQTVPEWLEEMRNRIGAIEHIGELHTLINDERTMKVANYIATTEKHIGELREWNAMLAEAFERLKLPDDGSAADEPEPAEEDDGWPGPKV